MTENALLDAVLFVPRTILAHLRLLAQTPVIWLPTALLSLAVGVGWVCSARSLAGRRSEAATTAVTLVAGAIVLLWFMQFGSISWTDTRDWLKEWTYFSALQQAVERAMPPFYLRSAHQHTDRFIANPETFVAPHALLLAGLGINTFFFVHLLGAFFAGFAALVALRRELALSPLPWVAFTVLFLFNGHITSHLAEGHTQWVSYLLLPAIFLALVRALRRDLSPGNVLLLASTLAMMILMGGWHIFMASVLLSVFVCVSGGAQLRFFAKVLAITAALSAYRVVPAFATYGGGENEFLGSYSSAAMLYDAVAGEVRRTVDGLGWHEYDTYVGHVGVALLCLGLVPVRSYPLRFTNVLIAASLAVAALATYDIYRATLFQLPVFVSQRVVTRYFVLSVLVLALLGCVKVDAWVLPTLMRSRVMRPLPLLVCLYLVVQLMIHTGGWRPKYAAAVPVRVDALKEQVIDPPYLWSVVVGALVSVVTAVAVGVWVWRASASRR